MKIILTIFFLYALICFYLLGVSQLLSARQRLERDREIYVAGRNTGVRQSLRRFQRVTQALQDAGSLQIEITNTAAPRKEPTL